MKAHLNILEGDTTNIVPSFTGSKKITLYDSWGQFCLRKLLLLMVTAVKIKYFKKNKTTIHNNNFAIT